MAVDMAARRGATMEAMVFSTQPSYPLLLAALDEHFKDMRQGLAVHASTACQPRKLPGLVQDLMVAGLQDAHLTGFGGWNGWQCTLDLPALFEAGDDHPYRVTVMSRSRQAAIHEPR